MTSAGRRTAARRVGAGALIASAIVSAAVLGRVTAPEDVRRDPGRASASPSPVTLVRVGGLPMADVEVELTEELEPHDYAGTAPAVEPTPIDGFYLRIVKLEETGGPNHGLPFRCLRCLPFRISPGVETLTLHQGRFYLEHQMSGFRALGHFRVRGDTIRFFNDPNCSSTEGRYRWSRRGSDLLFEVLEDPCPFVDERSDDLTYSAWTRVNACVFRILDWWPALLGC